MWQVATINPPLDKATLCRIQSNCEYALFWVDADECLDSVPVLVTINVSKAIKKKKRVLNGGRLKPNFRADLPDSAEFCSSSLDGS